MKIINYLLLGIIVISALVVATPLVTNHYSLFLPDTPCRTEGMVIKITDGDTVHVLDAEKTTHKIRLAGIDAPERGQPYGKAAGKFLSKQINQQTVCVDWHKRDRYKRLVGVIHYEGRDVNLELVKAGYAWHYRKYQREQTPADRVIYADAEIQARSEVIGLWSEPSPINPSDWRKGERIPKPLPAFGSGSTAVGELRQISAGHLIAWRDALTEAEAKPRTINNRLAIHTEATIAIDRYLAAASHGQDQQAYLFQRTQQPDGKKLSYNTVEQVFRHYAKQVGLPLGATLHSARATFITEALKNNCSLEDVQASVAHADISTTQMYDKRDRGYKESASFKVHF